VAKTVRETYYFEEPGEQNTRDVIDAVERRLAVGDIKDVVVASTSGKTAVEFAEALNGVKVYCVSETPYLREWNFEWPCLKPEHKARLEKLGAVVLENIAYVFHNSVLEGSKWDPLYPEKLVREVLYTFGQGMKVAVEVVLIAVATGYLDPYREVIGVGGSSRGADTAAVIRSTYPGTIFSKDPKKKLEIREIIAMPRVKRW